MPFHLPPSENLLMQARHCTWDSYSSCCQVIPIPINSLYSWLEIPVNLNQKQIAEDFKVQNPNAFMFVLNHYHCQHNLSPSWNNSSNSRDSQLTASSSYQPSLVGPSKVRPLNFRLYLWQTNICLWRCLPPSLKLLLVPIFVLLTFNSFFSCSWQPAFPRCSAMVSSYTKNTNSKLKYTLCLSLCWFEW